jgi:hypothetical protein
MLWYRRLLLWGRDFEPIDSGSSDAFRWSHRHKRTQLTHNLSFDHPRVKGDETHSMLLGPRDDFLLRGIVAGSLRP